MYEEGVAAIVNGKILTPLKSIEKGVVVFENGKILAVGKKDKVAIPKDAKLIDASNKIVAPGFIDIHTHGGGGKSLMTTHYEDINDVAKFFATCGTTSFLCTFMAPLTMDGVEIGLKHAEVSRIAIEKGTDGAEVLGIRLEGPYFSPKKPGAASPEYFRRPSIEEFEEVMRVSGGNVKIVDVAPEVEGALGFIREVSKRGIVNSIGHSFATYDEVLAGIKAGLSHVTHTFNAMRELHHREPGVVGAALVRDELTAELIADRFHVHPVAMKILVRCKGTDKVILITDSTQAAGLPTGEYEFMGRKVVIKDGMCFIPKPPTSSALEGTPQAEEVTLAGSTATMNMGVRNIVKFVGLPMQEAIKMATLNAAERIGVDKQKGSLEVGKDADIIIIDDDVNVYMTIIKGKVVYSTSTLPKGP
jgi:N-acetylglucosamine-6-phosphate deacetylase